MPRTHTVISGDRLAKISQEYYGIPSKFPVIIEANPYLGERREKGLIALDGNPYIYPGDILIIPDETIAVVNPIPVIDAPDTIDTEFDNAITIVIDNKRFQFFTGYSISSNIGSFDTVSIGSPYFDTDEYRDTFQPLQFKPAAIYYGKDLFFNSILLAPFSDTEPESETLSLNFYPKCGVLANCPLPFSYYPVEFNGLTLKQIAEECCRIYGIKVEFIGDPGAAFEKVSPSISENILNFLTGLAKERGFLITNNIQGNLLIWKAEDSLPVSFVTEGELPFVSCSPNFAPEIYYSEITGVSPETETKEADSYTWKNSFLSEIMRPTIIEIEDSESGDLKGSVESAAGRMFGSAAKYSLILNSHRDEAGDFFSKNKTIRVLAAKSNIYKEYNFLIESASLDRTADEGDTASLNLVLPGAYTGQLPEDIPWVP